jgi:hypothetical protein
MIVKAITSDSLLWNKQQFVFDLISAAQQGPVIIDLLHEGPDCVAAGIDAVIDQVRELLDLPKDHFLIRTSNQIKSSAYPEIRTKFVELNLAKNLIQQSQPVSSTLKHLFGIFIGRSNWQRLGLAAHLHQKYRDRTVMTFHYDHNLEFHRNNLGLEEFVHKHWDKSKHVYEFLKHLPIKHDEQTYPILWNEQGFGLTQQYRSVFIEIVCETYFTGRTFFITEKTLRCIINRRPFIVQGPIHYLKNLKSLGFKTFDTWWDEGYDQDPSDARYDTLCDGIDYIALQPDQRIKQWYDEMQPVLAHNVRCLQELTDQKIMSTEFFCD